MTLRRSKAEQTRFGRRYGKRAKMPVGEKIEGMDIAGRANRPPKAGPMIVPMLQTNGITAYARAGDVS